MAAFLLLCEFLKFAAPAQTSAPVESTGGFLPYEVTGFLETEVGDGSAAVVESPRVVASCAHIVFDEYVWSAATGWTNENFFYRAWNSAGLPPLDQGQRLRGYVRWDSYARTAVRSGGDSDAAFRNDFVAFYNTADLFAGTPPKRSKNALLSLRAVGSKMISGYPGGLYPAGNPLEFRLHSTGVFKTPLAITTGRFLEAMGPATGPGNSGGPVWVLDPVSNTWDFAGVLVSGTETALGAPFNSIGVTALDRHAARLLDSAIRLASDVSTLPPPQVFSAAGSLPAAIPDANKRGITIPIAASSTGKRILDLSISLRITHSNTFEDLQVLLRSPGGKTVVIANRPVPTSRGVFQLTNRAVSGFKNLRADGVWKLIVRDLRRADIGVVESAVISLSTR